MANKDPNEPISNIEEEDEEEGSKAQGDQARRLTPSETCAQEIQAQEDHAKVAVRGSGIGHPLTHVMAANNQMARKCYFQIGSQRENRSVNVRRKFWFLQISQKVNQILFKGFLLDENVEHWNDALNFTSL